MGRDGEEGRGGGGKEEEKGRGEERSNGEKRIGLRVGEGRSKEE